jgi:hypothetical protein
MGGAPGNLDGNNKEDKEAEALAMQLMEKSSRDMAVDLNVDLSGKPASFEQGGQFEGQSMV